jgi:hypothetical protein
VVLVQTNGLAVSLQLATLRYLPSAQRPDGHQRSHRVIGASSSWQLARCRQFKGPTFWGVDLSAPDP